VIDPARRQARVYRQDGTEALLSETDALRGEDVLPGFSCAIAAILINASSDTKRNFFLSI